MKRIIKKLLLLLLLPLLLMGCQKSPTISDFIGIYLYEEENKFELIEISTYIHYTIFNEHNGRYFPKYNNFKYYEIKRNNIIVYDSLFFKEKIKQTTDGINFNNKKFRKIDHEKYFSLLDNVF